MSKDNEIRLEAFIDEQGRLLARCKETKRIVSGLQSVSLSNSVDGGDIRHISLELVELGDEA